MGATSGYAGQAEKSIGVREVIRHRAHGLITQGERLLRLANALPAEMNPEAEQALMDLVARG